MTAARPGAGLRAAAPVDAAPLGLEPLVPAIDGQSLAFHGVSLALGGVTAVRDIDLAIAPGEIHAVIDACPGSGHGETAP